MVALEPHLHVLLGVALILYEQRRPELVRPAADLHVADQRDVARVQREAHRTGPLLRDLPPAFRERHALHVEAQRQVGKLVGADEVDRAIAVAVARILQRRSAPAPRSWAVSVARYFVALERDEAARVDGNRAAVCFALSLVALGAGVGVGGRRLRALASHERGRHRSAARATTSARSV